MYVKDSPTVGEYLHNETVGMLLLETSTANFYMAINIGRTCILDRLMAKVFSIGLEKEIGSSKRTVNWPSKGKDEKKWQREWQSEHQWERKWDLFEAIDNYHIKQSNKYGKY